MTVRSERSSQSAPAPDHLDERSEGATQPPNSFGRGLVRSVRLFKAFRDEQSDPDRFYRLLAADSLEQLRRHAPVSGCLVIDVGGGAGFCTEAFRQAGASCVLIEPASARDSPASSGRARGGSLAFADAVRAGRLAPGTTVCADGNQMPLPDGTVDIAFASNVLEHVPDPACLLRELVRVTRTGGTIYLSFTPWFSPWGGHETSPWHYVGGRWAANRFAERHGRPPGNHFGESLFACHVGDMLDLIRALPDVDVLRASPRYYPDWLSGLVKVPGLREVITWNLLVILRRNGDRGGRSPGAGCSRHAEISVNRL